MIFFVRDIFYFIYACFRVGFCWFQKHIYLYIKNLHEIALAESSAKNAKRHVCLAALPVPPPSAVYWGYDIKALCKLCMKLDTSLLGLNITQAIHVVQCIICMHKGLFI